MRQSMSCFGGCSWNDYSKNNKQRKYGNKEIKQIRKDKRIYKLTLRCLLLGTEESGKSTVIKQMRILHGNGFSNDEKKQKIKDIKENIRDAILIIIRAMSTLSPPIQLANADNQWCVNYIQDVASNPDFGYPPEFYEHTEILWKDKGVQATFERFHEYNLTDSAKYFLDRVAVVKQTDYTPSEQDILRCRVLTSGVLETKFQFDSINYHMIDVCGQQGERRKWMKCFNEMSAVIFVTACSSYDMVLHEDPSQNRLKESLVLFNSLWHNSWLRMIPFFLFLNKQDLLAEKIKSGKSKLVDYFSDFANYETPRYAVTDQGDEQEVIRAKYFIQDKFLRMCTYGDDDDDDMKICYAHFTCAVDTENIQRTFHQCREIIQPSCPCFGGSLL